MEEDVKTLQKLLGQVKSAAMQLKSRIHALDVKIHDLEQQRAKILHGALSKDDYLELLRIDIQGKAAPFRNALSRHLEIRRDNFTFANLKAAQRGDLLSRILDAGTVHGGNPLHEAAYYFYFSDELLAGVSRIVEDWEWPADTIPFHERNAAVDALDEQLDELRRERDQRAKDLLACGVTR